MPMQSSEDSGSGTEAARLYPCSPAAQVQIAGENERSMVVAKRIAPRPRSGTEKRLSWKALEAHFKKLREIHLRGDGSADRSRVREPTGTRTSTRQLDECIDSSLQKAPTVGAVYDRAFL